MALGDFTTLNHVKNWRSPSLTPEIVDDPSLEREISAASQAIRSYLQRDMLPTPYVEIRNGQGTQGMTLEEYPILAVTSVLIDQINVPPGNPQNNPNTYGYVFDTKKGILYVRGWVFNVGFQNIVVNYTAGYLAPKVPCVIDASAKVQTTLGVNSSGLPTLPGLWNSDFGVIYTSTGVALTPVSSAPAVGQYVPPLSPGGYYLFNVAEVAMAVSISYGFTPLDVEEACIQLVILEYNRRSRIGENTKNLAGENVSYYTTAAFTATIKDRLNPYKRVVPVYG